MPEPGASRTVARVRFGKDPDNRTVAHESRTVARVNRTFGACELNLGACQSSRGACKSGLGECQNGLFTFIYAEIREKRCFS